MPISGTSVSVATSATVLGTPRSRRTELVFAVPAEGVAVYVGGSAVTTSTGFKVLPGERVTITNSESSRSASEAWCAVTAAGTQAIAVIEVSA